MELLQTSIEKRNMRVKDNLISKLGACFSSLLNISTIIKVSVPGLRKENLSKMEREREKVKKLW